jgi:hypothetical protein
MIVIESSFICGFSDRDSLLLTSSASKKSYLMGMTFFDGDKKIGRGLNDFKSSYKSGIME